MKNKHKRTSRGERDLTVLSEQLRRHAEELAKISGRLASDTPTPEPGPEPEPEPTPEGEPDFVSEPEQDVPDLEGLSVEPSPPPDESLPPPAAQTRPPIQSSIMLGGLRAGINIPVRVGDSAISAASLPVLNAFREFLENERRRTRNRIIRLSAIIIGTTILIVGTGLIYAHQRLNLLEQAKARGEINSGETAKQLARALEATADLEKSMARERQDLHIVANAASNLNYALAAEQTKVSQVRREFDNRIGDHDDDLQRLQKAVRSLEIENALLATTVKDLSAKLALYENPAAGISDEDLFPPAESEENDIAPREETAWPRVPFRIPSP